MVTSAVATLLLGVGCRGSGEEAADAGAESPGRMVRTADEVLQMRVPDDLLVHRHPGGIQATAPDGRFRLWAGRVDDAGTLLEHVGGARETFRARGWRVVREKHYERALHLRLKHSGRRDGPPQRRDVWWVEGPNGRYVCDAIADEGASQRLGERVRQLCQSAGLRVRVSGPAPDAGAGGADAAGAR